MILTQYEHISIAPTSANGEIKFLVKFDLLLSHQWSSGFSLVEIIAAAATGTIVALAKVPDATTRFHHHLLRHRHHDAKEVGILECLRDIIQKTFWSCRNRRWHVDEQGWRRNFLSYRGRKTEDGLLRHQVLSEVHIILKIWKVIHFNPHLVTFRQTIILE